MEQVKNNKARILTSYYRPKPGGFCTRLFRAIHALLERGHEVHYLSVVAFPINHSSCVHHKFPWPRSYTDTLLFWSVFHLLAPVFLLYLGFKLKITHCFAFVPNYALIMQPLRLIKGIPLSLFLRADTLKNHQIKKRPDWILQTELLIEAMAIKGTRLYCVSQTLCDTVIERHRWVRPASSGVLRNNVTESAVRETFNINTPLHFACVGILEKRKNQAFLLGLFSRMKTKNIHLYLYGRGPDEDDLRQRAGELHVSHIVSFMGWVEVEKIWCDIDVLLFPSLHEGAPNAVIEALGHHIPVIASDIPEHREILPSICLLSLSDLDAWQKTITNLYSDPKIGRDKLIKAQQDSVKNLCFDWDEAICSRVLNFPSASTL